MGGAATTTGVGMDPMVGLAIIVGLVVLGELGWLGVDGCRVRSQVRCTPPGAAVVVSRGASV